MEDTIERQRGAVITSGLIKGTLLLSALFGFDQGKDYAVNKVTEIKERYIQQEIAEKVLPRKLKLDPMGKQSKEASVMTEEELYQALYVANMENDRLKFAMESIREFAK